ncbi:MAG TPA: response regulator transcription factor [Microlunatus sp.]
MRVVIADDALLLRRGVTALLSELGHEVVGEAGDVDELMGLLDLDPDAIIVDIKMPPTHTTEGLDATVALRRDRPRQAVLVLSQYLEPAYAIRLLAAGAAGLGYLLKDKVTDPDQLVDALRRLTAGESVIDPELVTSMLRTQRLDNPVDQLSPREREVLALMAEGQSNAAIADRLSLTQRTVESHVRSIFTRLDLAPGATDHRRVRAVLAYLGR